MQVDRKQHGHMRDSVEQVQSAKVAAKRRADGTLKLRVPYVSQMAKRLAFPTGGKSRTCTETARNVLPTTLAQRRFFTLSFPTA